MRELCENVFLELKLKIHDLVNTKSEQIESLIYI